MSGQDSCDNFNESSTSGRKPDPVFLNDGYNDDLHDLRKPLRQDKEQEMGEAIEKRQQKLESENRGPQLSQRELETLLDIYYARSNAKAVQEQNHHHARMAGGRMIRNLAFASSFALLAGFSVGLYTLSHQGSETALGQKLNQMISTVWQQVSPAQAGSRLADQKSHGKPIKTASLVVGDAMGTIHAGIPLKLQLKSNSNNALVEVKIINVPGDAVLTAGQRRRDGVWVLQPADLDNVALVMSSDRQTPLLLDVELVEVKTGQLLSPTREIKIAIVPTKSFKVGGL